MIKIYRDGLGTSILGTPTAREEMLECFFPCDGFSDARTMKGCGKQTAQARMCDSDLHNEDWCKNDGNVTGSYSPLPRLGLGGGGEAGDGGGIGLVGI